MGKRLLIEQNLEWSKRRHDSFFAICPTLYRVESGPVVDPGSTYVIPASRIHAVPDPLTGMSTVSARYVDAL